jgi:hypothetical protein
MIVLLNTFLNMSDLGSVYLIEIAHATNLLSRLDLKVFWRIVGGWPEELH